MTLPYAEVIGDPIAQSKSPLIHRFWLEKLGLEGDYRKVHVTTEQLSAYFAKRAADPTWRGCNVTVPHKQAVMEFAEDRGDVRNRIGAMNCIIRQEDGALIGTNTDAAGFFAPIADMDLAGAQVTVVGAGGAARAILFALASCDVGNVVLMNRSRETARSLLDHFALRGEAVGLDFPIPPSALIVNASSLGMTGMPSFAPDLSAQGKECIVYDIVYAPLETPLLSAASGHGLQVIDGLDMLIGQAAVAFELFFDAEPPRLYDPVLRERLLA